MSDKNKKNVDSPVKNKLSPGFNTDVYSKLDRLLFNKNVEHYVTVDDIYIKTAFTSFLNDFNLKNRGGDGNYIFISLEQGFYKFVGDDPKVRVYELPTEWDVIRMKIESYLENNPIEKVDVEDIQESMTSKQIIDIQESLGINQEVRRYFIDSENNRYYKGYTIVGEGDGVEVVLRSYDNDVVIESQWIDDVDSELFSNESEKLDFVNNLSIDDITNKIYSTSKFDSSERVEIKIYDSSKDGLLKSKIEMEIEGLKSELDEKGFATLSDGRVVITDKDKMKSYSKSK